mgnify:FL=1
MFEFLKKEETEIVAPVDGTCIRLEDVPDDAFASGKMGPGFAIRPTGEEVVSPVEGEIIMIPETHHAFGIQTKNGEEVLVHIGLNTVLLLGEGFKVLANQGDAVKAGDPIIQFDKALIESKGKDVTTIVTFTSGSVKKVELDCYDKEVKAGQVLVK